MPVWVAYIIIIVCGLALAVSGIICLFQGYYISGTSALAMAGYLGWVTRH